MKDVDRGENREMEEEEEGEENEDTKMAGNKGGIFSQEIREDQNTLLMLIKVSSGGM